MRNFMYRFGTLVLAMVMLLPMLYIPTSAEAEQVMPEYGDYYYHYDFENYLSGGYNDYANYFKSATATTAEGLACNTINDSSFTIIPGGTSTIKTDDNGNSYLNHIFDSAYGSAGARFATIPLGTKILGNSVAIDFRFRANGTATDTTTIPLLQFRRCGAIKTILTVDGLGRISIANIDFSVTNPVYTPKSGEFMDISVRWYDATNTVSVYIDGKSIVENATITTDFRATDCVTVKYNDSFIAESYSLANSNTASIQFLSAVTTNYSWSFDIDDIKIYQIATPEGLPYYLQNNFEGFDSLTDGVVGSESGNDQNANNKKIKDTDGNSYLALSNGEWLVFYDQQYQILSTTSWVLEFDIKNTSHAANALLPIVRYEDGGLGNFLNAETLHFDKYGNLYISNDTSKRIADVNISGDEWTHIAVVCVNDMSKVGKFGSFNSASTASSVLLRRTFAFYVDGKYIGSSDPKDIYTWNKSTGNRTLNGCDISSITTHTVDGTTVTALDTSKFAVVDSTTTANHTIYKSADGTVYYDVEYTDSAKTNQKSYSVMTLNSANIGNRGEYLSLFNATASINASIDNIKLYAGNHPLFMTENAVKEQDGILLDIDFGSYHFSNHGKAVSANGNNLSASGTASGETHGIVVGSNISSFAVKYDANGKAIGTNYGDTDYVNLTIRAVFQDLFFPYSATGVYSFEHTVKNIVPDEVGSNVSFFAIRREDANSNITTQPLVQARKNADGTVQLYTHYRDTSGGRPLFLKNGSPALIKNDGWQTIKVIYDESFKKDPSNTLVSFYLDGALLYLDSEGKIPAENIANTFGNISSKRYTPNQRIRFYYGGISMGTLDLKSLTIKSVGEKKHEMTTLDTDITLKNRVSVIESKIAFSPYSASADSYYPLIELTRTDSNTTRKLGFIYTEANDGLLYVKNTNGDYEKLLNADGEAIKISENPLEPTQVAIIYDDVTGLTRYYVDEYMPYVGESKKPAFNVQVADLDFYRLSATDESISVLETTADGFAAGIEASAYNTNYSGTSEIVGIQEGESTNDIRLLAGIDSPYYSAAGFEFEAYINGVSQGIKTVDNPAIYESIKAGDDTVVAYEKYGYKYFSLAAIKDIPYGLAQNSYVMARPYTVIGGIKTYGESAKIMLSDKGHYFDETYVVKSVANNEELFECSEIESYEGNGLAFNNQGAIFNFNADCAGKVYISLDSSRGLASVNESVFELTVDGNTTEIRLPIGRNHILLADVGDGSHAFSLKKISSGDFVRINSVTLDGTYTEPSLTATENGVVVAVSTPTSDKDYGDVTVYVQTSDESGKYYVEYPFSYQKYTTNPYEGDWTTGGNQPYNLDMYRINRGYIAERSGDSFVRLYQVLQNGEIGLALFEAETQDGIIECGAAGDAIGGFHGDENLIEVPVFMLDGSLIDISKAGMYNGTTLDITQTTIIDRCNHTGDNVIKHTQIFKLDTNGLRMKRSIEFLTSDYVVMKGRTFLQMFTFARQDLMAVSKGNYDAAEICNTINLLDASGTKLFTVDSTEHKVIDADENKTDFPASNVKNGAIIKPCSFLGNSVDNRYAEYIGDNNNGIYAKVGFNIVDASTKADSVSIQVRQGIYDPAEIDPDSTTLTSGVHGDNKWYPSFTSSNDPQPVCNDTASVHNSFNDTVYIPAKGEVWNLDLIYYIDYNPQS